MTTKERAIAAVAALRDRYVSHHAPPALNEELVDAVLEAYDAAGYAIVPREVTPEITRVYLNIQGPSDSGVPIEEHWRALVAAAEAGK